MILNNFFSKLPENSGEEIFEELINTPNLKIERIISNGHSTAPGEWYDQNNAEWVILLAGTAELLFSGGERIKMDPGDYIHIPAHERHRVESTSKDVPAIWLAVHYKE